MRKHGSQSAQNAQIRAVETRKARISKKCLNPPLQLPEVVDRAVREVREHDEPVLLPEGPRLRLLAGHLVEDLADPGHGADVAHALAHHLGEGGTEWIRNSN